MTSHDVPVGNSFVGSRSAVIVDFSMCEIRHVAAFYFSKLGEFCGESCIINSMSTTLLRHPP